jgi:hypothetical protein
MSYTANPRDAAILLLVPQDESSSSAAWRIPTICFKRNDRFMNLNAKTSSKDCGTATVDAFASSLTVELTLWRQRNLHA